MKKIFFTLTVLLTVLASAQDKTTFGINAGATFADLRGNGYAEDFDYGVNYLVGLSMESPINDRLSFVMNLNYEKKSPRETIVLGDVGDGPIPDPDDPAFGKGEIKANTVLHYISVPLHLKYYIGAKKNFFATGGLYGAVLAGTGFRMNGSKRPDTGNTGFMTFDYGLNFGVGTRFKLTETQNLNIELRDNLGLPLIMDDLVTGEARINSINLILNWQFSL